MAPPPIVVAGIEALGDAVGRIGARTGARVGAARTGVAVGTVGQLGFGSAEAVADRSLAAPATPAAHAVVVRRERVHGLPAIDEVDQLGAAALAQLDAVAQHDEPEVPVAAAQEGLAAVI